MLTNEHECIEGYKGCYKRRPIGQKELVKIATTVEK